MSYTNITANLNLSTFDQILQQANINTGDTFWIGMYWLVIGVVLISTMAFGFEVAMLFSFFVGTIIGIFLLYLSLITPVMFGISEAVLIFMIIYLVYSSRSNQ